MRKNAFLIILLIGILVTSIFFVLDSTKTIESLASKCSGSSSKEVCWKDLIEDTLERQGLTKTFELVASLYESDPDFARDCHGYTHILGIKAYDLFSKAKKIDVGKETGSCGYGFYHGFMIALAQNKDSFETARDFCGFIDNEISRDTGTAGLDCYHGIGHGVTDYNSDQLKNIGDEKMLVENSLDLCRNLAERDDHLARCANGVFHSVGDIYLSPEFSHLLDISDPLALCRSQELAFQEACFSSMGYLLMQITKNDFVEALAFSRNLTESNAIALIQPLAGYEGYRNLGKDRATDVSACRNLGGELSQTCFKGLVEGITDFGTPGSEEDGVFEFCKNPLLSNKEKDFCLKHAVDYFGRYFGDEGKVKMCSLAKTVDPEICR